MNLPQPVPGIVEQRMNGGLLLLRDDGHYLMINSTGFRIWQQISQARNLRDLAERISHLPGAPELESCENQARSFLEDLKSEGFLRDLK